MREKWIWRLQQGACAQLLSAAVHRAIISLLRQGSSGGLYDLVLLEHLKSACLLIILGPLSSDAGWSA